MHPLKISAEFTNTRYAILNTTYQLMSQQSLKQITLAGVARASGISTGGIKRYFPTMNELLNALGELLLKEVNESVTAITNNPNLSFRQQLRALFELSYHSPEHFLALAQIHAAARNNPKLVDFDQFLDASRGQLFNFFETAISNTQVTTGKPYTPYDLALCLYTFFESTYTSEYPKIANISFDRFMESVTRLLPDL